MDVVGPWLTHQTGGMPRALRCRYARRRADNVGKVKAMCSKAGTRRDFRSRVRHADESDAVVLFVVCDEGDEVVAVGDGASQEVQVEVDHLPELACAENNVCQCRRAQHFRADVVEVGLGLLERTHHRSRIVGALFGFSCFSFWGKVVQPVWCDCEY